MSEPANPQPAYPLPVLVPPSNVTPQPVIPPQPVILPPAGPQPGYPPPGYPQPVLPPQAGPPAYPGPAYQPPAYQPPAYPQPAYPPPGYPPPPYMAGPPQRPPGGPATGRMTGGKLGLLIGGIVVVVALIVAGLIFGIPGTGFHGLLPRESPPTLASPPPSVPTTSTPPVKSSEPAPAPYAKGYKQVWKVTPDSLGLTGKQFLWLTTITSSTWIIQASDVSNVLSPLYYLIGVDAQTGKEKWRTNSEAAYASCASQPIDDVVYCAGTGGIYSVDPKTGKTTTVTNIFQAGTIKTVDGQVTLDATAEAIQIEVLGGNLVVFDSDYRAQQDFTLISLVSPSGDILWTNAAPIFASCGSAPPPDVLVDGIIILNSLCMAGVFDVKSGKLLAQPAGYVGVAGQNLLWSNSGDGFNTVFEDSSGASWQIFGPSGDGIQFSSSELVAPLAVAEGGDLAWRQSDGGILWSVVLPGQWFSSVYDGKHLIVTNYEGDVWSLSPKDGSILWHIPTMGSIDADGSPGNLILADGTGMTQWDDELDAYDIETGAYHWSAIDFWVASWLQQPGSLTLAGFARDMGAIYRIDPVGGDSTPSPSPVPPSCLGGWTPPFSQEGDLDG